MGFVAGEAAGTPDDNSRRALASYAREAEDETFRVNAQRHLDEAPKLAKVALSMESLATVAAIEGDSGDNKVRGAGQRCRSSRERLSSYSGLVDTNKNGLTANLISQHLPAQSTSSICFGVSPNAFCASAAAALRGKRRARRRHRSSIESNSSRVVYGRGRDGRCPGVPVAASDEARRRELTLNGHRLVRERQSTVAPVGRAKRRMQVPDASALPHPRNKTISHPLHILVIPWQISAEKHFLIKDAPNEYREERYDEENAPPRTECERHRREQEQCARIHWVPDVRVRARRHDGLSLLYLNGRSGIAIRFHHHEEQQE